MEEVGSKADDDNSDGRQAEHLRPFQRKSPRDPFFGLPRAFRAFVHEPDVAPEERGRCSAEARNIVDPNGILGGATVGSVYCVRPKGHPGAHWGDPKPTLFHRQWKVKRWEGRS
jgi:hypothetical protein